MRKKNLLNLSVENLVDNAGESAVLVDPIIPTGVSVPTPDVNQTDIARLSSVADGLDAVHGSLGERVATIGLESLGNWGHSLEGLGAPTGKAGVVRRFIAMVIDYIKRFCTFIAEYGAKVIQAGRFNLKEAMNLQREAKRVFGTGPLRMFTVQGNAVELMSYGYKVPATSVEVNRSFTKMKSDIIDPIKSWFASSADVSSEIGQALSEIFAAGNTSKVSDESLAKLNAIQCPQIPRGWRKQAGKSGVDFGVAPTPGYGDVGFTVAGNESTSLKQLSGATLPPLCDEFNYSNSDKTVEISADTLVEFTKVAVGLAEAQIDTGVLYGKIQNVAKVANSGYTAKFIAVDSDGADVARCASINEAVNDAMCYLAYLMACVSNYNNYLNDFRTAITHTTEACIESLKD